MTSMLDSVNSIQVPFKVSARTAKLIGLENFSNEEGAIIELVKNTYDADSQNCIIVFDLKFVRDVDDAGNEVDIMDKESSKIYIIDNGAGMTETVITDEWMTIGTANKLHKHTSDSGRVKTGAKGIGRFALNRLGLFTQLSTVSKESGEGLEWLVDWRDFDKPRATVSDVEAVLSRVERLNLKDELLEKFKEFSPLRDLLEGLSFSSGTVIEISELNDGWTSSQLQRLFGNLEMLLPPKEQPDFSIDFFSTNDIELFGRVKGAFYDDFDYKVESTYSGDNTDVHNLEVKITRNELDVNALESRYSEVFDYEVMKAFPYRLEDFKQRTITIKRKLSDFLSSDIDANLLEQVGRFSFTFYFLKNTISDDKGDGDLRKYPYRVFDSSNRKAWLKRFGGVKIFRDDFRVRPYGEHGEDWLKLGERQAQSPGGPGQRLGGYRLGPNQIAGTVNISRIYNLRFQDKSGREGIIENDVFELFKNIVKEIISFFEKDRNTIMFHLSKLYNKKNKEAEALRKAQEEADRIKAEEEQKANQGQPSKNSEENPNEKEQGTGESGDNTDSYTDREKLLAAGVHILTEKNDKKDDEIRLLRSLASVGLIISSFAHEVKSLRSRLIPRTSFLLRELSNHIDERSLQHLDKDDNPFYMIRLMQDEDTKLKHWLEYSLNTLKRDKRERTDLNFNDYFTRFKSTWSKALLQRNINIILKGNNHEDCVIRAFEVDMDSIFNNLLSNSMNALKGHSTEQKNITIEWRRIEDNIEIVFSDNGKGLDPQYIENPDDIFNLNESSKTDSKGNVIGTGLGLYIVRTIIQEYNNSSISVISFTSGMQLKISFKTRK